MTATPIYASTIPRSSMPPRKQGRAPVTAGLDQVHHALPPPQQTFAQLVEGVFFADDPGCGNLLERLIDHRLRKMHDAVEPRLKVIQATPALETPRPKIQTLQGRI